MRARVFVRYFEARMREEADEMVFRTYVAESMRLGPQGKFLKVRWHDLVRPPKRQDPNEILADVADRGGLTIT